MIENWVRQYEGDPEFEFDLLAIDVGERIVERMEDLGMTRTELAAAVGVSKARISQILGGHDNLTLKSLVAVAVGLGSRVEVRLTDSQSSCATVSRRQCRRVDPSTLGEVASTEGSNLAAAAPEG